MSDAYYLREGWSKTKEYGPAVMTAALMHGGIYRIIRALRYPLTGVVVEAINAIIKRGFRDRIALSNSYFFPWRFTALSVATGVIVLVVGMFIGLWVNARSQYEPAP
jgi:hypothetical protein